MNVIGGGIFGLLLNLPNPGQAVLIYQAFLFVVIGFFVLRSQINGTSQKLAAEGFWQQYARERSLTFEDPSTFAATHAKANLPGTPKRVLTGVFAGVPGSLMVTGDGLKRGDSIALVGGETGPIATADLDVSAPGASAAALDAYAEQLAGELRGRRRGRRAPSPATFSDQRVDLRLAVGAGLHRAGGAQRRRPVPGAGAGAGRRRRRSPRSRAP